jgi:hypothetical protein
MDFLTKSSGYENTVLFTQYATHIQLNLQQNMRGIKTSLSYMIDLLLYSR